MCIEQNSFRLLNYIHQVNDTVDLYASHKDIMKKAAEDLGANW